MSNRIDVLATHSRFADHIRPIWEALPAERRGRWLTEMVGSDLTADLDRPILCSSALECHYTRQAGRRVIYIEHSVGQAYNGRFLGWAEHHVAPDLFLAPGPYAAEIAAVMWPGCPIVQVGVCKLDGVHRKMTSDSMFGVKRSVAQNACGRRTIPIVALSFRFTSDLPTDTIPECGGAFEHFRDAVPGLAKQYKILGHGHPRAMEMLRPFYAEHGIEIVETFEEVLARADCLVFDNSSVGFEFASTGRPVLCLNSPTYRPDALHGLRFYGASPGVILSEPEQLAEYVALALEDCSQFQKFRRAGVARAYVACDGKATERAVGALVAYLDADAASNP